MPDQNWYSGSDIIANVSECCMYKHARSRMRKSRKKLKPWIIQNLSLNENFGMESIESRHKESLSFIYKMPLTKQIVVVARKKKQS